MTVVLGNLCRAVPLHQALLEKVEYFFFPPLKKTVVQPPVKSVFSQGLHSEARRAIGGFFLYEDISFYAVRNNPYYQPMFML